MNSAIAGESAAWGGRSSWPPAKRRHEAIWPVFLLLFFLGALPSEIEAQVALPKGSDNQELMIPKSGIVRRGQGQRVTLDVADESVVALVHAEVGDRLILMMPDGRLDSVLTATTKPTKIEFEPATREEIVDNLDKKGFRNFKSRQTARYLYVYNSSEEFYKGTSRILETMYPGIVTYFKRLKIPVHDPRVPLVVIMFRTEEEFQKFSGMPPSVAAYYNTIANYIVMYEQSRMVEVAPELAFKEAVGTIAHEGVHQILHNIGVQQRLSRWPMWISEGLAEYFAPTSVDKRLRWKGVGMPHDMRMYELNRILQGRSDEAGEMVEKVVGPGQLTSSGYAAAWSLTHYLATRKKEKFQDYLREVAKLGPLEPREAAAGAEARALFNKYFGSDYPAIGEALVKHLRGLPYVDPIANQTHYVVIIDTASMRSAGVTSSPASVRKWQEETLTKMPAATRANARFQVMPFPNKDEATQYVDRFLKAN